MNSVPKRVAIAGAALAALVIGWSLIPGNTPHEPQGEASAPRPAAPLRDGPLYPPPLPQHGDPAPLAAPSEKHKVPLCSYGNVDPNALPAELETAADATILRTAQRAEESGDDRLRILGLSIHALVAGDVAGRAAAEEDQVVPSFTHAATPFVQTATQIALRTQDPRAYGLALRLCGSVNPDSPPEGCGALSVERWAQLDEDNALPWLLAARMARKRNDTAAFDDALARAGRARFFDRRVPNYGELLAGADLGSPSVRVLVMSKLLAAEARDDALDYYPYFHFLFRHCDPKSEPSRAELCTNMQRLLFEHSVDALGRMVGDRVGTPGVETGPLRSRRPAGPPEQVAPSLHYDLSCAAAERGEAWLRRPVKTGEAVKRAR